jgi:NTE family protein
MQLKKKINELSRALDNAKTYTEWEQLGTELDALAGLDLWKLDNTSPDYNYELIHERLVSLRTLQQKQELRPLLRSLREGLHHDLGNMGNAALYCRANVGTKKLIEDYVEQVCSALNHVCDQPNHLISYDEKLRFFEDTSKSFGQPALMLSGGATLGLFHIGVCKALHEQGLLPKVISGSSAGSIMAAMIGTHTDEELIQMYEGDGWYSDAWRWQSPMKGFMGEGFADQKQLETFLRRNIGEYSFEEAYARTGRHVNVTVSPVHQHQKSRLMNELTAPYLLIWSAVLASSAVPILFPPVTLTTKSDSGDYLPYMPRERWVDGSVKSDLPRDRLMHLFNVNYFIAVQVNPHIVPFMESDKKRLEKRLMSWPRRAVREELKFHGAGVMNFLRSQVTNEAGRQLLDHAYAILAQRYYGDVTIAPPGYTMDHYRHMLSEPNKERWQWFRLQGERATWPKIAMIRTHARISQALTDNIQRLEKQRSRRREDQLRVVPGSGSAARPTGTAS